MKKVLFLMFLLFLMGLGAAGVKAQVRIGGDTPPSAAAVLDLNADDDATPAGNKGALALPRVSLASTTDQLNGATPIAGMLVYNTNASITGGSGAGIYYWDGTHWVAIGTSSTPPGAFPFYSWDTTFNTTATSAGTLVYIITSNNSRHTDICTGKNSAVSPWDGTLLGVYYSGGAGTKQIYVFCYRALN